MFSSRLAQRAGVVAVAAAAVALPGVALAAPGSSATPARVTASRCLVSQLQVWGAPAGAAAGTFFYDLELSNISASPCTLYGFAGVSAVGSGGHQLGRAAARDHADSTHLITLFRGDTAHAIISIADAGNYPAGACQPANAIGLRVYPPNDYGSVIVGTPFRACRGSGPVYLHVRTTVRGTGIPGFSS